MIPFCFIVLKADKVKHLAVPHYDGLSQEDILDHLKDTPEFWIYMPEMKKEILKLPKQWVINVAWSVIG